MMAADLDDSMKAAEKEREDKAKTKAQREEDGAGAKGDLADTTSSRDEDQTYLDTLVAQCRQKSDDFEVPAKGRSSGCSRCALLMPRARRAMEDERGSIVS